MSKITKHILAFSIALVLTIAVGVVTLMLQKADKVSAQTQSPIGYMSTTTPYAGQINGVGGQLLLKGTTTAAYAAYNSGVLRSVTITGGPKGGTIQFFDATTSNVQLRTGNKATSTILLMEIPAGSASSTYPCNCNFNTGLLLSTSGSVPTSTITWE